MQITDHCVVSLDFRLTNGAGQVLDRSPEGEPLEYLHGAAGILPLLERALAGRSAGDRFDVTITPEEGFGERQPYLVEVLPRANIANSAQIAVGMHVDRHEEGGPGGGVRRYIITALDESNVTLDGNHPLAGETLHFQGRIVAVRAATAAELTAQ